MIKKCTKKITDWLIRCDAVKEIERELYEYAVYSILLTISPIFMAICFGFLLGSVQQSILIILPFIIIRKFSGGYHAKKSSICFISSSMLLILCIRFSFYIKCDLTLIIITVLSAISLAYFSPLENENRLLSREERIYYKKITIIIVTIVILVDLFLFWFHLYTYTICISIGLILTACLQVPCILKSLFYKEKEPKMT